MNACVEAMMSGSIKTFPTSSFDDADENKENTPGPHKIGFGKLPLQHLPAYPGFEDKLTSRSSLLPKHSASGWEYGQATLSRAGTSQISSPTALRTSAGLAVERLNQQSASQQQSSKDSSGSLSSNTNSFTLGHKSAHSSGRPDAAEIFKLKKELELANQRMAEMDIQLSFERGERMALAELDLNESHIAFRTAEAAIGSPYPTPQPIPTMLQTSTTSRNSIFNVPANPWQTSRTFTPTTGSPLYKPELSAQPAFPHYHMPDHNAGSTISHQHHHGMSTLNHGEGVALLGQTHEAVKGTNRAAQPLVESRYAHLSPPLNVTTSPWARVQPPLIPSVVNAEPLNYRQLLDRDMSCDWRIIVDKIVCSNDQQASIFLQQKLKQGTPEQKLSIVQAIIDQAYPLMVNRFGNFLVQRCFEHGSPDQIIAIARAIQGNTLSLSMDAFGCHVVQKAFDCIPEEYKAVMVHELLQCVPETVIHRYACHVWQKLFELRWNNTPPQIMKYVNEALTGMWHEVALGETGSLVVQNIFENCLEDDKRPCITEVLNNIDVVAHGQFGNWCIQHICEHGALPDRVRAIDHVVMFATEYSTDQFASKVIEKCLKVAGTDFLDRYLERVCEARPDRPRMPLIDVAGDQFGNYLIQYILTNADTARRELVATHIRKHLVSLRGSKYGSRVALLCCNPTFGVRPNSQNSAVSSRYGGRYSDNPVDGPSQGRDSDSSAHFTRSGRAAYGSTFR